MNPHIHEPSDTEAVALNSFLDERIYEFNVSATGFRDGKPFAGIIKDESANVMEVSEVLCLGPVYFFYSAPILPGRGSAPAVPPEPRGYGGA